MILQLPCLRDGKIGLIYLSSKNVISFWGSVNGEQTVLELKGGSTIVVEEHIHGVLRQIRKAKGWGAK